MANHLRNDSFSAQVPSDSKASAATASQRGKIPRISITRDSPALQVTMPFWRFDDNTITFQQDEWPHSARTGQSALFLGGPLLASYSRAALAVVG